MQCVFRIYHDLNHWLLLQITQAVFLILRSCLIAYRLLSSTPLLTIASDVSSLFLMLSCSSYSMVSLKVTYSKPLSGLPFNFLTFSPLTSLGAPWGCAYSLNWSCLCALTSSPNVFRIQSEKQELSSCYSRCIPGS